MADGITWHLVLVLIAIALGTNFQLYSNSVINNLISVAQVWVNGSYWAHYKEQFTEEKFHLLWSLSTASLHFGAIFGSIFTKMLADSPFFGRRKGLILLAAFTMIGGAMCGFAKAANSFELFAVGRFTFGIALGAGSGLAAMLISEIAPLQSRGACGAVQQLFLGFGNFLSQFLTLPQLLGTSLLWPLAVAVPAVPAAFQMAVLFLSPESPRYLYLNQGKAAETRRAVAAYQGAQKVDELMADLQRERLALAERGKGRF